MFLEELTGFVELESAEFECKARLDRENVLGWLKTVAGFGNVAGGTFPGPRLNFTVCRKSLTFPGYGFSDPG